MSITVAELRAILTADTAQFDAAMRRAGSGLTSAGRSMTSFGRTATTHVTLPLLAIGYAATKSALNFNESFAKIEALAGSIGIPFEEAKTRVMELAHRTGQSAQETADALYFVASAGLKAAQVMPVLGASAKAAMTGMGDSTTIAQLLTSVMHDYAGSGLTAAKAMNILTGAIKVGKAEPADLAASLGTVIPVASQMKVGFEDVAAAVAQATNAGVSADRAVTGLRFLLASFQSPTAKATAALKDYGFSVGEIQNQLAQPGGLLTVIQELADTFDLTTVKGKAAFAAVVGGARGAIIANTLVGDSARSAAELFEFMGQAAEKNSTLFKDAQARMRATSAFQFAQALSDLKTAAIELGNVLVPILVHSVLPAIQSLVNWFKNLSDGTKELIVKVGIAAAALGPLALALGGILRLGGGLVGFVSRAVVAIAGLGSAATGATGAAGGGGLLGLAAAHPYVTAGLALIAGAMVRVKLDAGRMADAVAAAEAEFGSSDGMNKILQQTNDVDQAMLNIARHSGGGPKLDTSALDELQADLRQAQIDAKETTNVFQNFWQSTLGFFGHSDLQQAEARLVAFQRRVQADMGAFQQTMGGLFRIDPEAFAVNPDANPSKMMKAWGFALDSTENRIKRFVEFVAAADFTGSQRNNLAILVRGLQDLQGQYKRTQEATVEQYLSTGDYAGALRYLTGQVQHARTAFGHQVKSILGSKKAYEEWGGVLTDVIGITQAHRTTLAHTIARLREQNVTLTNAQKNLLEAKIRTTDYAGAMKLLHKWLGDTDKKKVKPDVKVTGVEPGIRAVGRLGGRIDDLTKKKHTAKMDTTLDPSGLVSLTSKMHAAGFVLSGGHWIADASLRIHIVGGSPMPHEQFKTEVYDPLISYGFRQQGKDWVARGRFELHVHAAQRMAEEARKAADLIKAALQADRTAEKGAPLSGLTAADLELAHHYAQAWSAAAKHLDKLQQKIRDFRSAIKDGFSEFADLAGVLTSAFADYQSALDQYAQDMASYQDAMKSFTEGGSQGEAPTMPTAPDEVDISALVQTQVANAARLAKDLQDAAAAGLSKQLLAQFAGQGAAAIPVLEELMANPALIAELNAASEAIAKAAGQTANALGEKFFGAAIDRATARLTHLQDQLEAFIAELKKSVNPKVHDVANALDRLVNAIETASANLGGGGGGHGGGGGGGTGGGGGNGNRTPIWEPPWHQGGGGGGGGGGRIINIENLHVTANDPEELMRKLQTQAQKTGRRNAGVTGF